MTDFLPTSGPGNGLYPKGHVVTVTNRSGSAIAKNDCVMFDLGNTATECDNNTPGSSDSDGDNSGFNTVVDPATTELDHGVFGIAQEAIADNASGEVMVRGVTDANVIGTTVAYSKLTGQNANPQMILGTGSSGFKIIAIALEADTANVAEVWFDGVGGFSTDG